MKKTIIGVAFLFCTSLVFSQTERLFRFKFHDGDKLSMVSRVEEDVTLNGQPLPHDSILNRIKLEITSVDDDGSGNIDAEFMTSENFSESGFFTTAGWEDRKSKSLFKRSVRGEFKIGDEYFMPTVRNIPRFPEKAVKIGESWKEDGYEAQDFRRSYNIKKPVKYPFKATYTYLRDEETTDKDGKPRTLCVIQAKYNLAFENPVSDDYIVNMATDPPVYTMGYSNRTIWWDNERGQIDHYNEDFRIQIETFTGNVAVFSGKNTTEVTEFVRSSTDENLKIVQDEVQSLGLSNVSVEKSSQGLKISLKNIQFEPDSARLVSSEKAKIRELAKILRKFPNDILVSGHTASAKDEDACQKLSEERADSVAKYLESLKVRSRTHIFTEGFGSRKPIGDNTTEMGRAQNRRVELTILDK